MTSKDAVTVGYLDARLRRLRKRWAFVWTLTLLGSVGAIWVAWHAGQSAGKANVSAARLDAGLMGACHRLQTVRDGENTIDARVYLILGQVVDGIRTNPTRGSAGRLDEYVRLQNASRYRPATDCEQAVRHPLEYRPPTPVPMSTVSKTLTRRLAGLPPRPPRP